MKNMDSGTGTEFVMYLCCLVICAINMTTEFVQWRERTRVFRDSTRTRSSSTSTRVTYARISGSFVWKITRSFDVKRWNDCLVAMVTSWVEGPLSGENHSLLPSVCLCVCLSVSLFVLVYRTKRRPYNVPTRYPYDSEYCSRSIAVLVYQCLNGLAPSYLADDCQLVSDVRPRRLRLSDSMTCAVRRTRTTYGDRCFAVAGPRVWISLPTELRHPDSLGQFKRQIKTHLFGLWNHSI